MSSQQLMCVWQTVYAKELCKDVEEIPKEALQQITSSFGQIPNISYSDAEFDDAFTGSSVNLQSYSRYINCVLRKKKIPKQTLYDEIEKICWNLCKPFYKTNLNANDVEKFWQVFTRLTSVTSYPPIVTSGDVNWFVNKMFDKLQRKWRMTFFDGDTTFTDFLSLMESLVFHDATTEEISSCVNEFHQWLVIEEIRRETVKIRSKLHANWTPLTTKICRLTSKKIIFEDPEPNNTTTGGKDYFFIKKKTRVEKLPESTEITGRLKLFNGPTEQCEIAVGNENEAEVWMSAIKDAVNCSQNNTSPVQMLIQQLREKHDILKSIHVSLDKLVKTTIKYGDETPSAQDDEDKKSSFKEDPTEMTNNILQANKMKIKGIFLKIDKNGNGIIEKKEFAAFIERMGLKMTEKEVNLVFNSVDKDNNDTLSYDEFEHYLLKNVMDETSDTDSVNSMRMAFMDADRNGSGTLNFHEFLEYIWNKKSSTNQSKLLKAFSKVQEETGSLEVDFDQFQQMLLETGVQTTTYDDDTLIDDFEMELKNMYDDIDIDNVVRLINDRWKSFINFNRKGSSGKSVMTTDGSMVADFVPGEYSLVDLACFNDLPPLQPKHTVVKNFKWISSKVPEKSGKLLLPTDFDGRVATETATNQFLRYYGCSFADSNAEKVILLHRHGIQDFTYENRYLEDYVKMKGAGVEKHNFSHLDCPLSNDSGIFVLGKLTEENNLHLTGFKIPTRHVLYVPRGTIHSNDYLTGTWRTMLSDAAPIDHVRLTVEENGEEKPITFTFV